MFYFKCVLFTDLCIYYLTACAYSIHPPCEVTMHLPSRPLLSSLTLCISPQVAPLNYAPCQRPDLLRLQAASVASVSAKTAYSPSFHLLTFHYIFSYLLPSHATISYPIISHFIFSYPLPSHRSPPRPPAPPQSSVSHRWFLPSVR